MSTTLDVFVPLSEVHSASALTELAVAQGGRLAGMPGAAGRVVRKALDARKGFPLGFRLTVELFRQDEQTHSRLLDLSRGRSLDLSRGRSLDLSRGRSLDLSRGRSLDLSRGRSPAGGFDDGPGLPPPRQARSGLRVAVIGSGPAGTFAALRLVEAGAQVIVLEQGKAVQPRRRDLALLTRGQLNPASNYCFGEGGAGTFSDGKLYTRTKDKAAVRETLLTLVRHGADPDIAIESRPHIGSNRLPQILIALREHLKGRGVEYFFEESLADLLFSSGDPGIGGPTMASSSGRLCGVRCASGREVLADAVVLAVGHSARPVYELCRRRGVTLLPKAFSVGARIEHPQALIDQIQYGRAAGHPALPAAFYQLTANSAGRGVYSFCMCPGGWIVPSSTEEDGICVNGMSLKRRDSPFANSALVVTVEPNDFVGLDRKAAADPLAGVAFQRAIEQRAFAAGGGGFVAPAQRLDDFMAGRPSAQALGSTYRPQVVPGDLGAVLPAFLLHPLRDAVRRFQRTMPGFLTPQAQLVGVETRTSAPVRIVRDESFQSPALPGLYPCGEGAGYAGGIVSAAIDGLRVADAILA